MTSEKTVNAQQRMRHGPLTRISHECRHESFETDACLGFSQVRPTEAYWQSVESLNEKSPPGKRIGRHSRDS